MEEQKSGSEAFELGTWLGRRQAFSLTAARCSVADIECLAEIYENKRYRALDVSWDQFCNDQLGITPQWAGTLIRRWKTLGPGYFKLNNFARIKPADYRRIADAVSDQGLAFEGEIIPMEPEKGTELAHAVEVLRREATPEAESGDPSEQAFSKAEKSLQAALSAFELLQAMNLDEDGRLRLVLAVEAGRDRLDGIRLSTTL